MWANADLITAGKYKTLCVAARLNSQKKMQKALKSNDDNISSLLDMICQLYTKRVIVTQRTFSLYPEYQKRKKY